MFIEHEHLFTVILRVKCPNGKGRWGPYLPRYIYSRKSYKMAMDLSVPLPSIERNLHIRMTNVHAYFIINYSSPTATPGLSIPTYYTKTFNYMLLQKSSKLI